MGTCTKTFSLFRRRKIMTNLQFLLRFIKTYNLLEKETIREQLKVIISGKMPLNDEHMFNFINHIGSWNLTKEGRNFWELKHYQLFKFFYNLSENKENARYRIQKQAVLLNSAFFIRLKKSPIWNEIEQFKNEILL